MLYMALPTVLVRTEPAFRDVKLTAELSVKEELKEKKMSCPHH